MSRREEIVRAAREDARTILTEVESKQIISEEGIAVVEAQLATSKREAMTIARKIGFPVALKTASPKIVHKSDNGGVRLHLRSGAEVGKVYSEVANLGRRTGTRRKKGKVSVQKMAPEGIEVIMGMSKDPQFGPVIMFGLGGVFVETLGDISLRIVPITQRDAREMIEEIKGYPVLKEYRGKKSVDIRALEDILLKLSGLAQKAPEIRELDLNPVFAYTKGAVAADARIILERP
ncbi:MAG: acetate--CoA ligase family protein [Dehalococcoidia bacterium]